MKQGLTGAGMALAVLLAVSGTALAQDNPPATSQLSEAQRLAIVLEHSHRRIEMFPLQLDLSGPRESIDDKRFLDSQAISLAAHLYAIDNLDFEVTMRELMEHGYWPFAWYPEGLNIDMPFGNFNTIGGKMAGEVNFRRLVEGRDDPVIIMEGRRDILRAFYRTLYAEDCVSRFDELERLDSFWFNEVAGSPMQESTDAGDFSMVIPDFYDLFGNVTTFNNGVLSWPGPCGVGNKYVRLEEQKRYPLLNFFWKNEDGELVTTYLNYPDWNDEDVKAGL